MICYGVNCLHADESGSIHSEQAAFKKLFKLLRTHCISERLLKKGIQVINLALTKAFKVRMSRPCKKCSEFLQKVHLPISRISWTDENSVLHHNTVHDISHGSKYSSGYEFVKKVNQIK